MYTVYLYYFYIFFIYLGVGRSEQEDKRGQDEGQRYPEEPEEPGDHLHPPGQPVPEGAQRGQRDLPVLRFHARRTQGGDIQGVGAGELTAQCFFLLAIILYIVCTYQQFYCCT